MSSVDEIGATVVVFCRASAFFMVLPGLSSIRTPAPVRLWLAIAVSLAFRPVLPDQILSSAIPRLDASAFAVVFTECAAGLFLALVVRVAFSAVHLAGGIVAQVCGYSHPFAADDGHGEPSSELGAVISIAVVAVLIAFDLHHLAIEALLESYALIPIGAGLDSTMTLETLSRAVNSMLKIAATLTAPYIIVSILINFAFGMLNRLAPQLPVYFISTSFLIGAMLWLSIALLPAMVQTAVETIIAAFVRS